MKRGTIIVTATVYWWLVPTAMVVIVMVAVANAVRHYLNGDYIGGKHEHTSEGSDERIFRVAGE
jgi:hypothetical protein